VISREGPRGGPRPPPNSAQCQVRREVHCSLGTRWLPPIRLSLSSICGLRNDAWCPDGQFWARALQFHSYCWCGAYRGILIPAATLNEAGIRREMERSIRHSRVPRGLVVWPTTRLFRPLELQYRTPPFCSSAPPRMDQEFPGTLGVKRRRQPYVGKSSAKNAGIPTVP
jgi:hypothetical protein